MDRLALGFGWGALRGQDESPVDFGIAAAEQFGPAPAPVAGGRGGGAGRGSGGVNGSTIPALVRAEWSEQDVMHVFTLIKAEYPIDPKRTFLYGYSAGGNGGHYIAQKYAENWTAIALGGSNVSLGPFFEVDRIKNIPMMVYSGSEDPVALILLLLGVSVGLPYFLLAANSPLLQAWFARARPGENPYRLFAVSNLGSLVALALSLFFAVACSGALAARGVAYAGRFSVHLLGAGCALTVCAMAALAKPARPQAGQSNAVIREARPRESSRSSDPARD